MRDRSDYPGPDGKCGGGGVKAKGPTRRRRGTPKKQPRLKLKQNWTKLTATAGTAPTLILTISINVQTKPSIHSRLPCYPATKADYQVIQSTSYPATKPAAITKLSSQPATLLPSPRLPARPPLSCHLATEPKSLSRNSSC